MNVISDILLAAGALGAAFYCIILSRRLSKFNDLENGVGGAVATLAIQVDDMTTTLKRAQKSAGESTETLQDLTRQAEVVAKRLELLLASMHDLPQPNIKGDENQPGLEEEKQDVSFFRHNSKIMEAAE